MPKPISVTELKKGDIVSLVIITDIFQTKGDYIVESKNRYSQEGGFEWFEVELQGGEPGEKLWLEWEEDDKLEIELNLEKVTLKKLGLNPQQLEEFDEEGEGYFTYKGVIYEFCESDEALFYKNCTGKGVSFFYWDFEDEEGEYFIGVKKWSRNEYEAHIGIYLDESDIEIYPS